MCEFAVYVVSRKLLKQQSLFQLRFYVSEVENIFIICIRHNFELIEFL